MRNQLRAHYLSLANAASEEPEPTAPEWPNRDWSQDFPLDLPDDHGTWDWPDAPDPRVNDRGGMMVVAYIVGCFAVIVASLTYLIWQAL